MLKSAGVCVGWPTALVVVASGGCGRGNGECPCPELSSTDTLSSQFTTRTDRHYQYSWQIQRD